MSETRHDRSITRKKNSVRLFLLLVGIDKHISQLRRVPLPRPIELEGAYMC